MSPLKKLMLTCLLPLLIAGVFTVSASLRNEKLYLVVTSLTVISFSVVNVMLHLLKFQTPSVQGRLLAIVGLPCVYAFCSYIGISMTGTPALAVTVLDGITEAYSAFALLMFFDVLCEYFVMMVSRDFDHLPQRHVFHNLFPITYLQPYEVIVSSTSIRLYRKYTYQYLITRLVGSFFVITLVAAEIVPVSLVAGYLFNVVSFVSGWIALIAVWTLYIAVKEDIRDFEPGKKFMCLKASVFFSFTQMLIIKLIDWLGFLVDISPFKVQSYLMFGEMALLSGFMFCYYLHNPAALQNRDVENAMPVRHRD